MQDFVKKLLEIAGFVNLLVAFAFWILGSVVHAIIKKLTFMEAFKYTIVGMFLGCLTYILLYYQFHASHVVAVAVSSAISAHSIKVSEILDKILDEVGKTLVNVIASLEDYISNKFKK